MEGIVLMSGYWRHAGLSGSVEHRGDVNFRASCAFV
jgi:hypothetical protein